MNIYEERHLRTKIELRVYKLSQNPVSQQESFSTVRRKLRHASKPQILVMENVNLVENTNHYVVMHSQANY